LCSKYSVLNSMFIISYILVNICSLSLIFGQDYKKEYTFVNVKEGISKLGVSSIIQDKKGYIWMGTNGAGLHRFDGIDYVTYSHSFKDSTSISSSLVYCTYLDKKNRLWVGTEEGLNLYDNELDHFIRYPIFSSEDNISTLVSIRSIQEDNSNNLLLGTSSKGVFKLNMDTYKASKIPFPEEKEKFLKVSAFQMNKEGLVFVATSEGLLEYETHLNYLRKSDYFDKDSPIIPVYSLLIDNENILWVGSVADGVFKIQQKSKTFIKDKFSITNKQVFSIIKHPDGTLLCGTENGGLIHLNTNGEVLKHYVSNKIDENSISSNSIWSLLLDKDERLWLGFYNSGVAIYDNLYDKFRNIESSSTDSNSLKIGSVTGIVQDRSKKLWITMDGGGVDIYDPKKNKFTHVNSDDTSAFSGITSNYLECIFVDSQENLWIGSWDKGIFLLEKGSEEFINYTIDNTKGNLASNTVLSITEDKKGIIWLGTFYKGLHSYNPITKKIKHYNSQPFEENDLAASDMRKVIVDSYENIWVGTTRGLFKIIKKNENDIAIISMKDKMSKAFNNVKSANHILSLYESENTKYIWIGTKGAGLCRYNTETEKFTWFNKINGLSEENITGIIGSLDGNLWVSGNSGIFKYNSSNSSFTNYTYDDGLLSNDFNMNANYRDPGGQLYFGNYKGVDFFKPNSIVKNTNLTQVFLTGFKIFNKKVVPDKEESQLKRVIAETDSITLSSKQSVFTIDYTGINYTRPEKNQYAYYLEGLEKSWNYVGNARSATYTNLNHGIYTFKLKAANNDGLWNEKPPPWWKTNWALFSYVGLLFLGLYLLNKLTKNRIKERQSILNERKQREQEDILHEKKLQFFTNISHEFRTPLTLMVNPLEDIISDESLNLPDKVKNKHNIIRKNTYRLHRLINELMDFSKLESNKLKIKAQELNLISFTNEIVSYFKEEADSNHIYLSLESYISDLKVWGDSDMLEKIIFNILSNAFKVTPQGGAITIEMLFREECIFPLIDSENSMKAVEIIISDTGPGLEQNQVEKIFERFYQVENLNKTYYGGTGIGLEVVQNFVKLHKGKLEVNSKVGEGTSFKILLPCGNNHFLENEILIIDGVEKRPLYEVEVEETFNTKEIDKSTKVSKSLLIVEDNNELRRYLRDELKHQYDIKVAVNGKVGLKLVKEFQPDVVITDVIMPEMDGFEFCERIKSDIATSHIPVLMLTAKTQIDDRIAGIEKGADAYMVKPFDMRLVSMRLSQLITSRQMIFDKFFRDISGMDESTYSTSIDQKFIQEVLNFINENIGEPDLSVELLASNLKLSRSQLYRKIKALTGYSANEFIRRIRLQKAKTLIENGATNIKEVCYNVGFSSPSYFTKCFKSHFGILPTEIETIQLEHEIEPK